MLALIASPAQTFRAGSRPRHGSSPSGEPNQNANLGANDIVLSPLPKFLGTPSRAIGSLREPLSCVAARYSIRPTPTGKPG